MTGAHPNSTRPIAGPRFPQRCPGSSPLPEHLGRRKGSDLFYAGKVDHGFDMDSAKELEARLSLISKTQTLCKEIAHRGIWVEPALMAEIEYRAKSAEGKARHPVFKGLREDF
jgi:bifunctional non-homologous end joining protein LigD